MYRPEFWPEERLGAQGPMSVFHMCLDLHMNSTGSSSCLSAEDRELFVKCLRHSLQNWRHNDRKFDNLVHALITETLSEHEHGIEEWSPPDPKPTWTKDIPSVNGYYWVRTQMSVDNGPWQKLCHVSVCGKTPTISAAYQSGTFPESEIEYSPSMMFAGPIQEPDQGSMNEWAMSLNKYQRDNLLLLIRMICGKEEDTLPPFTFMNTGDWVGEIRNMLEEGPQMGQTNITDSDMRQRIATWRLEHVKQPAPPLHGGYSPYAMYGGMGYYGMFQPYPSPEQIEIMVNERLREKVTGVLKDVKKLWQNALLDNKLFGEESV